MELTEIISAVLSDGRIFAAILGLYGLMFATIFNSYERRRSAKNERKAHRDDLQKAIYAEINSYIAYLERDDLEMHKQIITKRIIDEDFTPFIPSENHTPVFRALLPNIHVLPLETIDAITYFYASVNSIEMLVGDMRGELFSSLERQRRAAIYQDYMSIKQTALLQGKHALYLINLFSKGGNKAIQRDKEERRKMDAIRKKEEVSKWIDSVKNQ